MIYEIVAGGITFTSTDTDLINVDTGIYYGTSNLQLRRSFDYDGDSFGTQYIYAGSRTVVYRPAGNYDTQYLTITSVTPLYDEYSQLAAGQNNDFFSLIFLGVIAVCAILTLFFRR